MIPKYPNVPEINESQIKALTEIVFSPRKDLRKNDAIFVFGSTHPACVEATFKAFEMGLGNKIVISGGSSNSREKHKDWTSGDRTEADSISSKLIEMGIPKEKIYVEDKATNSKENVILATQLFDFSCLDGITIISKNYVVGRQARTLKKYINPNIHVSSFGYNVALKDGTTFDEENWMISNQSKALVFGEYLRIILYGRRGDIINDTNPIIGLEKYIKFDNEDM